MEGWGLEEAKEAEILDSCCLELLVDLFSFDDDETADACTRALWFELYFYQLCSGTAPLVHF